MLGQLRLGVAKRENRLDPNRYEFLWVVDFPMFEWLEEEKRWEFMHHPFTAPLESDASRLESDPGSVRARAYDLVLNGSEIGGGSIRIHDQNIQRLIFKMLGMSDEEAKARFGFFVDALEFGTPPHGGIALGLDRIVAILAGEQSIREVIAFPKTAQAVDLMAGARRRPSTRSSCGNSGSKRNSRLLVRLPRTPWPVLGISAHRFCQPPPCARFRFPPRELNPCSASTTRTSSISKRSSRCGSSHERAPS